MIRGNVQEIAALDEHVARALQIQSLKDIRKSEDHWKGFQVEMTGELLQHLSPTSKNRMTQEANYEVYCTSHNAVELYKLIKQVHSIEQDGDVAKRNAIVRQFTNMTQGPHDYNAYCKRFNSSVRWAFENGR